MSISACPRLLPDLYGKSVEATWRVGADTLCSLEDDAKKIAALPDAMGIEEKYLDVLAEDRQTYWTQLADTPQRKRTLIKYTRQIHAKKGTAWAIRQAFTAIGLTARVLPWYRYGGAPYHYRVEVLSRDREITPALLHSVEMFVTEFGAVRDISDGVDLTYLTTGSIGVSAGTVGETATHCLPLSGYTIEAEATVCPSAGTVGEVYIILGGNT